jgi:hypothetical protein
MVFELKVNRAELIDGLAMLRKLAKPKKNSQAFLSYDQGNLVIDVGGTTVRTGAEGAWPGKITIGGKTLVDLAKLLPPDDPLSIRAEDYRLYFGSFSIPCDQ